MKFRFLLTLFLTLIISTTAFAKEKEREKVSDVQKCPVTKMTESCLTCHSTPGFEVKEKSKYSNWDIPLKTSIITEDGKEKWYFVCEEVCPTEFQNLFRYIDKHPEVSNDVIIEIHNPGGSAFDGWRAVNIIINEWAKYEIETRLYGMAFSAGFMIFNAGEVRTVAETAELMWHEIAYFSMFEKVTPKGTEEKLKMMRHLQDTANTWLSKRSGKITKEDLDKKASGEQGWWFNGQEAFDLGFADKLLVSSTPN